MSKTDHTLSDSTELSRNFINQIKLPPFNKHNWFIKAYSTIQRTLCDGISPLSIEQKEQCKNMLFTAIPAIGITNFDQNLKSLILNTSNNFSLTIGQAQKLVSILCKYAFTYHLSAPSTLPPEWSNLVKNSGSQIPVPIDTIVLFFLNKNFPQNFKDVNAYRTFNKKTNKYIYQATVNKRLSGETTWSRLMEYEVYWSLQIRIRDLAQKKNISPLEFEMRHLWITE